MTEEKVCFFCKGTKVVLDAPCPMCHGTGVDILIETPMLPEGTGISDVVVGMINDKREGLARLRAYDAKTDGVDEIMRAAILKLEHELIALEHMAANTAPAMSDKLMKSWDRVSIAINRMVLAQPSRMTEASEKLRLVQSEHQDLIIQESRRVR